MLMKQIQSSNIKAAGFENGIIRVQFSNGTQYDYQGANEDMFNSFMRAESQGKFFHQTIKGKLTCTKVVKEEDDA